MIDVYEIDTITIRLAGPETIANWAYKQKEDVKGSDKSWGHGEITENNYREKDDFSIFSQPIFGPKEDYTCACTNRTINPYKIKKLIKKGTVCKKCGVAISPSRLRRERFGYIHLAVPVANPLYLDKISKLIGISEFALKSVLDYKMFIVITCSASGKYDLNNVSLPTAKIMDIAEQFAYKPQENETVLAKGTGGDIILKLLKLYTRDVLSALQKKLKTSAEINERVRSAKSKDKPVIKINEDTIYENNEFTASNVKINESIHFGEDTKASITSASINAVFEATIGDNVSKLQTDNSAFVNITNSYIPIDNNDIKQRPIKQRKKNQDRLDIIRTFLTSSGVKPEYMIIQNLPVLPPDLRPNTEVDNMIYTNPLNDVYSSIVSVNKILLKAEKPLSPLYHLDCRKLQNYVNTLFLEKYASSKRKLKNYKALATGLSKKSGIFRRHLLGKRVNYSARSVILVDPSLKFNECAIPKRIALELFRPFIINLLCQKETNLLIKDAEQIVDQAIESAEELCQEYNCIGVPGYEAFSLLLKLLDKESSDCPVILLNRTPTLHKLSIQAFIPKISNDNAIHLHPLVCAGFNADFDGDTMAIHLPITQEAQLEARKYMLASKNILSPSTGKLVAVPTQDMILGLYYHTLTHKAEINKYLPYTKKSLAQKIDDEYDPLNPESTVGKLDYYKTKGYFIATDAGLSIAATDFPQLDPNTKKVLTQETEAQVAHLDINKDEKKYIGKWCNISDKLYKQLLQEIPSTPNICSPFKLIADSGARGNEEQFKQICVMRGLFKDTTQKIIPAPIQSSLMEGMSSLEYFISCHGTRKGLTDTALNTASSGYLTRRLMYAAQEIFVTEEDCSKGSSEISFIEFPVPAPNSKDYENLVQLITGRYLAMQLADCKINELITRETADKLVLASTNKGKKIRIRSVLSCKCRKGICQKCYGLDPTTRLPVKIGAPIGIIAAQSLSEPTTQFILRTFHNGGSASTQDITDSMDDLLHIYDNNSELNLQGKLDVIGINDFRPWLLKKLRDIYIVNGVDIKPVHIEIILKQMLRKQADGKYVIRSLKECATEDTGFLKSASFEKTATVLAEAALQGKTDSLDTIAACVMVGKKPITRTK